MYVESENLFFFCKLQNCKNVAHVFCMPTGKRELEERQQYTHIQEGCMTMFSVAVVAVAAILLT